jgi:CheY-like chemotaxis protein/HPt (histidine-containing phosphotransfer) domain-containing protein
LPNVPVDDAFDAFADEAKPKKGKVLIAEDIKTNRLILSSLLETLEIESVEAVDGKEAVEMFKADPTINFILMDVKMPVMDGVEATVVIREWEEIKKLSATPIIAVTAFDFAEDIKRCMDSGMNDVMFKPADLKTLAKTVEKYLTTKKIDLSLLENNPAEINLRNLIENRQEEVFSQEWLTAFVLNHKKLASVLLHGAMNDMPNYFKLLREAIEEQNWIETRAVVHVLKGLLRQVGSVRLSTILNDLNGLLKSGGTMDQPAFETILKEYQLLEVQLQDWLKKNS